MECLEIIPSSHLASTHAVPGSKSYTNRALTIAALADGASILRGALISDDTHVARRALAQLGIAVREDGTTFYVDGQQGRFSKPQQDIFLGNSGTATRFFTAMLTIAGFSCTLSGNARMQERPIADLLAALRQLGADVVSLRDNGCPPVRLGAQCLQGGQAEISGAISSQFLSALLMIAPYAARDTTLIVRDTLVSVPYVDLTLDIMTHFGVAVRQEDYRRFSIKGQQYYSSQDYTIEGDASSATYFWGLAALLGQSICITNIPVASVQADVRFLDVLQRMGCTVSRDHGLHILGPPQLHPLGTIDLNALPDAAMTVAVLAAFCDGVTELRNLANLRVKETDRLRALATELRKLGVAVTELPDGLRILGSPERLHGADIMTYDDHRIAMCFGMAGARVPGIRIHDPDCVSKTYPRFWDDLQNVGVNLQKAVM